MKNNWDLIGLAAAGLAYLLTFSTPLRVPLGVVFLLYLPGYALTASLFPRQNTITLLERQGIAIGLSIATLPVQAIVLRYLRIPFSLVSIVGSVSAVITVGIVFSVWRRKQLGDQAFRPGIPSRGQTIGIIFSLLVVSGFTAAIVMIEQSEAFTEFYIGGEGVNVSQLFRTATPNESLSVNLVVANQERHAQNYYYELWIEDSWTDQTDRLQQSSPFEIAHDTTKMLPIEWQMPSAGSDQQVHFYLFKVGDDTPYRQLTLWVDVTDDNSSQ